MSRSRRVPIALLLLGAAVVIMLLLRAARRTEDQRLADLGACLLGAPLSPGEKASARMLRIDLARPQARLTQNGQSYELEDRAKQWPERCAGLAQSARDSHMLAAADRDGLAQLADALGADKPAFEIESQAADHVWPMARAAMLPSSTVPGPWNPVELLEKGVVGAELTPRRRSLPRAITGGDRPDHKVHASCFTGTSGAVLFDTPTLSGSLSERTREIAVGFFDEGGVTSEPARVTVVSRHEESQLRHLQRSDVMMNCRPGEAHVGWAWSTLIDQKATHEIVVVTCTPARCDVKTSLAHVETSRQSGCGYCFPAPDQFLLTPPVVIDLFGATALLWNDQRTVRMRVGAMERLADAAETVLWHEPAPRDGWFPTPVVQASGDVALVQAYYQRARTESRVFQLDGSGVRELAPGSIPGNLE